MAAVGAAGLPRWTGRTPMPELICTTVYQFPELSEAAKEKAGSWYRELGPHDGWWDAVYEDFERVCEILGIRLKTTPRPPHGRRDAGEALHLVLRLLEPRRWGLLRRLLVPCQGRGRPHPGLCPDGRDAAWHRRPAAGYPAA